MATLFYGNGECSIDSGGSEIRAVEIEYTGVDTKFRQTAGDSFYLISNSYKVMIFPVGLGYLSELFVYRGTMRITSLLAVDNNGDKIPCKIKRVMDYSELLSINAEDMTTKSENINVDDRGMKNFANTGRNKKIIDNLHTKEGTYLSDGSQYAGSYHIHLKDGSAMTGSTHTSESKPLYIKRVDSSGKVIQNLVPVGSRYIKHKIRRKRRS